MRQIAVARAKWDVECARDDILVGLCSVREAGAGGEMESWDGGCLVGAEGAAHGACMNRLLLSFATEHFLLVYVLTM